MQMNKSIKHTVIPVHLVYRGYSECASSLTGDVRKGFKKRQRKNVVKITKKIVQSSIR